MTPFDRRDGWIWLDGALRPWREARLHVLSHGLHYASAVFEGERAYGGRVFRLANHGRRLVRSAEIMDLGLPHTAARLDEAVLETLEANGLTEAYVRRVAWRGSEQMGVAARQAKVHVAIAAWDWPGDPDAARHGLSLTWARYRRPPPDSLPWQAKAAGLYMVNTLSKHHAQSAGHDDAMLLDWRGYIAEATGANVFFLRGRQLHTPVPDCFLGGITRQAIILLARARGLEVFERQIKPAEIARFEGCFLTGSAAEILPVTALGAQRFPVPEPLRRLMADYAELVRETEAACGEVTPEGVGVPAIRPSA